MFKVTQRGDFRKTEEFLGKIKKLNLINILQEYGQRGVDALSNATPKESGLTAESWRYEIVQRKGYISLRWHNTHVVNGRPIAVLLQYGHGTREGGYVHGIDYINPAIQPIFAQIAEEAWKEVTQNG